MCPCLTSVRAKMMWRWTTTASTCITTRYKVTPYNHYALNTRQADSASGQSTPDTIKPREVLDEVMDPEAGTSPFRPSWIYGFNPKSVKNHQSGELVV